MAEKIDATVYDMRFVKPADGDAIEEAAKNNDLLVTLEENVIIGGAGDACLEVLAAKGIPADDFRSEFPIVSSSKEITYIFTKNAVWMKNRF